MAVEIERRGVILENVWRIRFDFFCFLIFVFKCVDKLYKRVCFGFRYVC